ncbi:hypothetical protein BDB00DRAFT_938390 [Zychaea mexicana]|uniref:uncharacterized protein n=1 Tax=Zychaea mexicana TaxID=64656 RepID=UPI0022FF0067|nr:uncharacterized protein BDB00DRAFT_938390 [Zychaea mexicana]KAI9494403.1 hypothetical protein BDB00DRAFT_938390 [Zychaea mexicana]
MDWTSLLFMLASLRLIGLSPLISVTELPPYNPQHADTSSCYHTAGATTAANNIPYKPQFTPSFPQQLPQTTSKAVQTISPSPPPTRSAGVQANLHPITPSQEHHLRRLLEHAERVISNLNTIQQSPSSPYVFLHHEYTAVDCFRDHISQFLDSSHTED